MTNTESLAPVRLWRAFEARDWETAAALLHDDFVGEWPVSNERFVGRDAFIRLNREYPGDWHITIDRVVAQGDCVVTQVHVDVGDARAYALSFFDLKDGLIVKLVDWWPEPYDPPEWRKGWAEPIRSALSF
jgi:predicted SnoaL-like aldol condensation-catalyzing enzyme